MKQVLKEINNADILIVGAGLTGATYAERLNEEFGYNVVVIDKRDHIAGNAYTEKRNNIDVHVYGAHIFHTPNKEIWDYVNEHSPFNTYEHRVLAKSNDQIYTLPFTLKTLSEVYGYHMTPKQAKDLLDKETRQYLSQTNLEDRALSLVGKHVYETLIRDYTMKQWDADPRDLDPSIINRLPVRMNFDTRYFNDAYQGIPAHGYTWMVERMLDEVQVFTGVDYFQIRDQINGPYVIYTGAIDEFFDYKHGKLNWRSVKFDNVYFDEEDYQGIPVMNYCDDSVKYTRVIEHKHFNPRVNSKGTWVSYEFSCPSEETDNPYYPVNLADDRVKMKWYEYEKNLITHKTWIGGRLGAYKYFDMHQAIGIALKNYRDIELRIRDWNNGVSR